MVHLGAKSDFEIRLRKQEACMCPWPHSKVTTGNYVSSKHGQLKLGSPLRFTASAIDDFRAFAK